MEQSNVQNTKRKTLPPEIQVKCVTKENVSESLDDLFSCIQRSTFIALKVIHSCNTRAKNEEQQQQVEKNVVESDSPVDISSVTSVNATSLDSGFPQSFPRGAFRNHADAEESSSKEEYKRLRQIVSNESILEVVISSFRRRPPKEYVPEEGDETTCDHGETSNTQSFPFSIFCDAQYSVRVFRFLFLRNKNFSVSSDACDWLYNHGDLSEYFRCGISYSVPQYAEEVNTPGDSFKGNHVFKNTFVCRPGWSEILPPTMAHGEGALLLRYIAESRVPLVVADGLDDLMALYHAFHAPLPKRLDSFLAQLSLLLPRVYDIRCLIEDCLEMDGSNIDKVYESLYDPTYLRQLWKQHLPKRSYPSSLDFHGKEPKELQSTRYINNNTNISSSLSMETLHPNGGDYEEDDEHNVKLLEQRIDALLEDNNPMLFDSSSHGTGHSVVVKEEDDKTKASQVENNGSRRVVVPSHSRTRRKWHSVHGGCIFEDLWNHSEWIDFLPSSYSDPLWKAFEIGSIFATFIELYGWSKIVSSFERKIYQSSKDSWLVLPAGFAPFPKADICFPLLSSFSEPDLFHSGSLPPCKSTSACAEEDGFSSWFSFTSCNHQKQTSRNSHNQHSFDSFVQSQSQSSSLLSNLHVGGQNNNNIRSEYLNRLGLFSSAPRTERTEDAISVRVNRFLDVCVPTSFSELRREAVFRVVASIIKRSIGAQSFCYGSFATKTYHADSVLEIGAFLVGKKETSAEWSAKLMAALCEDATRAASEHSSNSLEFSYLSLLSLNPQEHPVALPVRNISYVRPKPTPIGCQPPPAVTFTVNWPIEDPRSGLVALDTNSTERDIAPNVRVSVTLNHVAGIHTACVLEEFDHAMGRNHLFKKSLLLVRTWVDYGVKLTETLPSRAVEVMVVFIANCFHSSIETPFDLLYRFLSYFVQFDWRKFGLCETGIIDLATGQKKAPIPCENYLFSPNARQVLVYCRTGAMEQPPNNPNDSQEEEQFEVVATEALNIFDHVSWKHYRNICVDSTENDILALEKAFHKGLRDAELFRSAPTAANLQALTGSAWKRHIDRWKLIDTQLALLIDRSLSAPVTTSSGKSSSCFPFNSNHSPHHSSNSNNNNNSTCSMGDDTRPLVYISSAGFLDYFKERDPLYVDMTTLRNNLEYVRFIVNSEVTELGLVAFLTQILAENGCLLIGEIGQHLRSTFGKQDWSSILKERFGGLKRFLLKHSELFYVDNDHPLNPHIYLRASIHGPLWKPPPQDNSNTSLGCGVETKKSKKNKKQQHSSSNCNNTTASHPQQLSTHLTTSNDLESNRFSVERELPSFSGQPTCTTPMYMTQETNRTRKEPENVQNFVHLAKEIPLSSVSPLYLQFPTLQPQEEEWKITSRKDSSSTPKNRDHRIGMNPLSPSFDYGSFHSF